MGDKTVLANDIRSLRRSAPSSLVENNNGVMSIKHPNGAVSRVSRSLGDRMWKLSPDVESPLVFSSPELRSIVLRRAEHPFVLLLASPILVGMNPQELVEIAQEFPQQPRAACGEMATRAVKATMAALGERGQCTALEVCFLPVDERRFTTSSEQPPAAKKAKLTGTASGTQSMRLRHILITFSDGANPTKETGTKGSKTTRTRQEAETMMRELIGDLRKDMLALKNPKDVVEVVSKTTTKFVALCRKHSECETAKKGGNMCGELGWMTPEDRGMYGATFKDVVDVLLPGQLSDIALSNVGVHLVQRMA